MGFIKIPYDSFIFVFIPKFILFWCLSKFLLNEYLGLFLLHMIFLNVEIINFVLCTMDLQESAISCIGVYSQLLCYGPSTMFAKLLTIAACLFLK